MEDNNSFFRAVAEAISGSQKSYRKIRLTVVKYMEMHSDVHMNLVGKGYASVSEYIEKSQMRFVGSCATDIEIQATANAFGVNIFKHSNENWVKYSCMATLLSSEGIYIKQCKMDHFETVVCVQHIGELGCFSLCSLDISESQYRCRRSSKAQAESTASISSSDGNYCFSKYLKRKERFQKLKYCAD